MWKFVPPTGSFSRKSNSFSYKRFCTKTRFETEAQDDQVMPIYFTVGLINRRSARAQERSSLLPREFSFSHPGD